MTRIRLALVVTLAAASSCNLDTTDRISQPPRLRAVNAAISTSSVNLHLNANSVGLLGEPLDYEGVTPSCVLIIDDTHQLSFVQGGTALASVTSAFAENASYLVLLLENAGTFKAVLASDTETAPTGSNGLRFINATTTAGDVYVTGPGEVPSTATLAAGNLAPAASSTNPPLAFVFRPETATRIRLYNVGNTTTPRADLTLTLTGPRRLTTIVFTQPTFAEDPAAIQVNACP